MLNSYQKNEKNIRHCLNDNYIANDKYIHRNTTEPLPLKEMSLLTIESKGERLRGLLGFIEVVLKEHSQIVIFISGSFFILIIRLLLRIIFNIEL